MSQQSSVASVHTVRFIKGLGTFRSWLSTSSGVSEVYQRYQQGDPSICYPDFSTSPEIVTAHVASQAGELAASDMTVNWYIGAELLSFNTSGVCTTTGWTGKVVRPAPNQLKFTANLPALLGASSYIRADITFDADGDGQFENTFAMINIVLTSVTDNDRSVIITGTVRQGTQDVASLNVTDNDHSADGGTVTLSAQYFEGVAPVSLPSGWSLAWELFNDSAAWAAVPAASISGGKVKVTADDINTTRLYRVTVKDGSGADVCKDTERVRDLTDKLEIIRNPSRDEVIYAPGATGYVQGTTDQVTYTPALGQVNDAGEVEQIPYTGTFGFTVIGPDGETVGAPVQALTYTLTYAVLQQTQSDVQLVITATL